MISTERKLTSVTSTNLLSVKHPLIQTLSNKNLGVYEKGDIFRSSDSFTLMLYRNAKTPKISNNEVLSKSSCKILNATDKYFLQNNVTLPRIKGSLKTLFKNDANFCFRVNVSIGKNAIPKNKNKISIRKPKKSLWSITKIKLQKIIHLDKNNKAKTKRISLFKDNNDLSSDKYSNEYQNDDNSVIYPDNSPLFKHFLTQIKDGSFDDISDIVKKSPNIVNSTDAV